MPDQPLDLSRVRILITNDDGIAAEGLAVLERIAASLSDDIWVCAPEIEQSAASHSLTIHRPLRLRQLDARRFATDGTPTDCVLLALNHLMRESRPGLVLSGVNRGSNIGEDVTYSGTVAAAMEATLLGVPAVALSQHVDDGAVACFDNALAHGAAVIRRAAAAGWPPGVLINLNFPSCPADRVGAVEVVRHGNRKIGDDLTERQDPRGRSYFWIGQSRSAADILPDTDVAVIGRGGIAVTPLALDLTDRASLQHLKRAMV
ncbi:MAG: 5'/3'-nucleotidase SurE [Azospirillum sp.]|nr:5'/3'-nucleotidase SurE [Azospirillum sp.]